MNLFVKNDERVHFSFNNLNIVGDTGIALIFSPAQEWAESELKNIPDSLMKIFPLIGKETVSEFYVYKTNLENFPKTFMSIEFIGIEGFLKLLTEFTFIDKE